MTIAIIQASNWEILYFQSKEGRQKNAIADKGAIKAENKKDINEAVAEKANESIFKETENTTSSGNVIDVQSYRQAIVTYFNIKVGQALKDKEGFENFI